MIPLSLGIVAGLVSSVVALVLGSPIWLAVVIHSGIGASVAVTVGLLAFSARKLQAPEDRPDLRPVAATGR